MSPAERDITHIDIHMDSSGLASSFMTHELGHARKDLVKKSHFRPLNDDHGPYHIDLSVQDNRLIFDMRNAQDAALPSLVLSLNPYRRLIRDYFLMIQSYETLRAAGNAEKLEAVDMGRRGLHNEAAELMMTRLGDKVEMDLDTARRFFTLICALQTEANLWR